MILVMFNFPEKLHLLKANMKKTSFLVGASVCVLLGLGGAEAHAGEGMISSAETLLFETNHLEKINQPVVLHYKFKKEGTLEEGFDDDININVDRIERDGGKYVTTSFLTGTRKKNFPAVEHALGNPVLLYFLERDITEMERLTGGKRLYFQKRIRLALASQAKVRPVTFIYNGKPVSGTEIKVSPYLNDPMKTRFAKYSGKYYLFTLSDKIPGEIYQMAAVIPDIPASADQSARTTSVLVHETLTFSGTSELPSITHEQAKLSK